MTPAFSPALFLLILGLIWAAVLWWLYRRRNQGKSVFVEPSDLLAGGLLFLTTMGFFWRTISGDVYQPADGGDLVSFLFPTYRFAASQISQWSLPLWNPHLYGGAPFISDIQAGFFYPPNLLLFFLNPAFDYRIMQTLSQLHIYWAGLGTYVLIRTLRFGEHQPSSSAAFLGALAFQFSDPLLIHLGNLNLIAVLSWMPWILAAFHRALSQRSIRWSIVAAVLFAIANYAGHAQSSVYLGFGVGLYWLFWTLTNKPPTTDHQPLTTDHQPLTTDHQPPTTDNQLPTTVYRPLATIHYLLITVVLTLVLTMPILLPAVQMAEYTERADLSYQETVAYSLAPTQAIGLITPSFFGRGPALHWSLWDRVETPYAGLVTLLLAILGLLLASHQERRQLWIWFGLAFFGFVVSFGVYAILHGWLTLLVPGFDQFRAPARALVLWTLGISVLAAFGVDAIRQVSTLSFTLVHRALRWGAIFLAGVVLPLAYLSLLLTQDSETMFLRASVAAIALTIAAVFWLGAWAVIAAYQAQWMSGGTFGPLMVVLLFAELTANGGAYLDVSETDPTTGYQHPEIVEFLKSDPVLFRIDTRTDIQQFWQPDAAAYHGLQDVWGVANPLVLEPWKALWDATGGRHSRIYDMLNVKYVILQDGVPLPEGKFELVFDAPGELSVHQNLDFMPRAWVVYDVKAVADQEAAFAALRDEVYDPMQSVILIEDEDNTTAAVGPPDPNALATFIHYGSSEMNIEVQSAAAGYLVLSEVWYPGWRATVNGEQVEIEQANGAQRAIYIPAGESDVKLWFAPLDLR